MTSLPRILFIDAYDSFSNNIIALLENRLNVEVKKIYIDAEISDFAAFLAPFAAIVCGPGPGHPEHPDDVGLFKRVWALDDADITPALGICLGFQSLVLDSGGVVNPLPQPRHGIETFVRSSSQSIFENLPEISVVQYHSLHASLGHQVGVDGDRECLWQTSETSPKILPLAWDFGAGIGEELNFRDNPGEILMAVKHTEKPFYGIQFHPESICSQPNARRVVDHWWKAAQDWQKHRGLAIVKEIAKTTFVGPRKEVASHGESSSCTASISPSISLPASYASATCTASLSPSISPLSSHASATCTASLSPSISPPSSHASANPAISAVVNQGSLTVPRICKILGIEDSEAIILDSEMRQMKDLGEATIIGIIEPTTKKIRYSIGADYATWQQGDEEERVNLRANSGGFFGYIKEFMTEEARSFCNETAFHGGLMGYITYEACLETIGVQARSHSGRPDICFAFVERSIVVDHKEKLIHIQSLRQIDELNEKNWLSQTTDLLNNLSQLEDNSLQIAEPEMVDNADSKLRLPKENEYKAKVNKCKDQIYAGNSYELCLTDQTQISLSKRGEFDGSSWRQYLRLRQLNPAPFAAYVKLGNLTLLSTSPERFMSWSRFQEYPGTKDNGGSELVSTCQFRPIKGTVKKERVASNGRIHKVTLKEATALLSTKKERAENLMIVDLIRHDVHGVVASSRDVDVRSLMVVEEYESVFQLVSVIEGRLFKTLRIPPPFGAHGLMSATPTKTGIDMLAASLPPGSMTGAPKRRSCQLLQEIEHKPRSVYSGVLGYICVTGKGDFSVVIRSVFKWDDSDHEKKTEEWSIGAGGAVTGLSSENGEWEEMLTKLNSTLKLFNGNT